jgi:serine/threonine protein kinase
MIIEPNDHILYRFEIKSILGKGSFAQVVSAYDHKDNKSVALKINRNTEVDHKFAESEAKLLKQLMTEDPKDENNIVKLMLTKLKKEIKYIVMLMLTKLRNEEDKNI